MKIYPAIDIINGRATRLYQGQYDQATTYPASVVEIAGQYVLAGAKYMHIIDLDGAKTGKPVNQDLIKSVAGSTSCKIQVGGGLRTRESMENYLDNGVSRVIIGSLAVKDPVFCQQLFGIFSPERITLAVDVRASESGDYLVATHGWKKSTATSVFDLIETYRPVGLKHMLCTDISRDGTLQGPNFELYQQLNRRFPEIELQVSGGIHALDDLVQLKKMGMPAVIIGKALYENRFSLQEAINVS